MPRNEPELPEPGLRVQLGERRNLLPAILQTLGLWAPGCGGRGLLGLREGSTKRPSIPERVGIRGLLACTSVGSGGAQMALTLLDRLLPAWCSCLPAVGKAQPRAWMDMSVTALMVFLCERCVYCRRWAISFHPHHDLIGCSPRPITGPRSPLWSPTWGLSPRSSWGSSRRWN
ncbi:unnamed protein product [Rangifer tarandus platyrhynchus]|uniref:Uncharacterized protein n=1 Tax=Rangifer tarandus platyrhynchus TaxID=3082113 RepID=A0AC59YTS0_RANTA